MPTSAEASNLDLNPAQIDFLETMQSAARAVIETAFTSRPDLAAEIFGEDHISSRQHVLAHKLIHYVAQAEASGDQIEDVPTIADAVLELAPGNFNPGSRRQHKAKLAVEQWFDLDYSGSRIIGSTLLSVIQHHRHLTAQQAGELKNRHLGQEVNGPERILTTSEGLHLFEMKTKAHLEDESAVLGHCIGTASGYSHMMARGIRRYFSLRRSEPIPDDKFEHTTIEYDVDSARVIQMKGKKNAPVNLKSPHLQSILEALTHIRDNIAIVADYDFSVSGLRAVSRYDLNFYALRNIDITTLRAMADVAILSPPLRLTVDEDLVESTLVDIREVLNYFDITELCIDIADNELVSHLLEKIGHTARNITFNKLEEAKGLRGLKKVVGYLKFPMLADSGGLEGLEEISGNADFPVLTDASGLQSLQRIGGRARFPLLVESKGLERLEEISGNADFPVLTDASGLQSLQRIGGRAFFGALENSKGLSSLYHIGKAAHFRMLREASDLTSLEYVGARAHFEALVSAVGLEQLKYIGSRAYLHNLTSSVGLEALQCIGGYVYANHMSLPERNALRSLIDASRKHS